MGLKIGLMAEQNLRQGDILSAPGIGSVVMDQRIKDSPLAQQQTPPRILLSAGSKRAEHTGHNPTSPTDFGSTLNAGEEVKSRAERLAEFREQNALIQARNIHVRDVFLENMRSERDRRSQQIARDRAEKREMWN